MIAIQFWKLSINPLKSSNRNQRQQTPVSSFSLLFLQNFVSDINCLYISKLVKLYSSSYLKFILNTAARLIISLYVNCFQLYIENMKYHLYFFLLHNDTEFIWYCISSNKETFFTSNNYLKLVGRMVTTLKVRTNTDSIS